MSEQPAGKGRPTPKRRDAQGRRTGPVPPPPTTRREAAKRLRAKQAEARAAGRPERDAPRMLKRDQGPVRALVRDVVDARRNVAVLVIPVVFAFLLASISQNEPVIAVATRLYTLVLLLVVVDSVVLTRVLRRRIAVEHPEEARTRGHVGYGLLRTITIRRFRVPPPRVRPGPLLRRRA